MKLAFPLVFVSLLASWSSAQVVVVEGGGPALQVAIDQAAEGAILLVKEGDYEAIDVQQKSLTVVADTGQDVVVRGVEVTNLLPDQVVVLQGLVVDALEIGIFVRDCEGELWLESCAVQGGFDGAIPGPFPTCGDPGAEALRVRNSSHLSAIRCLFLGGGPGSFGGDGGAGVRLEDSTLACFDSVAIGATGSLEYCSYYTASFSGPGLSAVRSRLFLSNGYVRGGPTAFFQGTQTSFPAIGITTFQSTAEVVGLESSPRGPSPPSRATSRSTQVRPSSSRSRARYVRAKACA